MVCLLFVQQLHSYATLRILRLRWWWWWWYICLHHFITSFNRPSVLLSICLPVTTFDTFDYSTAALESLYNVQLACHRVTELVDTGEVAVVLGCNTDKEDPIAVKAKKLVSEWDT